MRSVSAPSISPSQKIDGSLSALPEVIFQPSDFGDICAKVWAKPDTALAVIAGVSDRAARDYLNGNVPPPGIVIAALNLAITRRKRK